MNDTSERLSCRAWCLAGAAFCLMMMAVALILQYVFELEPCPLCIFQRVAVLTALIVFVIGALHNPKRGGGGVYGVLALLGSLGGAIVAGRHVWLQHLPPDQVPSCGPGLDYMLEVLPLWNVMSQVLSGSGECAEIHGMWLGLSLPMWTLMGFIVLSFIPIGLIVRSLRAA
ncbi:disulfide bond formation protein B [Phytohalomonas tamaricis]|uniref:disulfide bond formation protein B n=1 Tax=Phytohalomonas tamaricis TaxID=2081032 RepID=UPI000D0BD9E2|nr:disulfide bond formation protein B [Phytohalomonas tamaricis]